jgi:hypothetical protein
MIAAMPLLKRAIPTDNKQTPSPAVTDVVALDELDDGDRVFIAEGCASATTSEPSNCRAGSTGFRSLF